MTITIGKEEHIITVINVFVVGQQKQQELADLLTKEIEEAICFLPGFISATIHKSKDGTRVANYAQWETDEDRQAIFKDPKVKTYMDQVRAIAKPDPHLYEVVSTTTSKP